MSITTNSNTTGIYSNNNNLQLLYILRNANMQSTADQQFTSLWVGTNWRVLSITAIPRTGDASVACAGGIYDAPSKGGNGIVATSQNWVSLATSTGTRVSPATPVSGNTSTLGTTLYLSLTTGSTAACTADIFIHGSILD